MEVILVIVIGLVAIYINSVCLRPKTNSKKEENLRQTRQSNSLLYTIFAILTYIVNFFKQFFVDTNTYYKKTATGQLKLSKDYLESLNRGHVPFQKYSILQKAAKHRRIAKYNLEEHFRNNPQENKLDLHNFTMKEVPGLVETFLECCLQKDVSIITGRGLHSENGIPRIKPEVVKILTEKKLKYSWQNEGCLKVKYSFIYKIKIFLQRLKLLVSTLVFVLFILFLISVIIQ